MFSIPNEEEQVEVLMKEGKYSDAIIVLEQILPQFKANEAWEAYVKHLNLYSQSLWRDRQLDKALKESEKILTVCISLLGEQHPETAQCYNNLGACQFILGNLKQAINYYEQSLAIRLVVLEKNHYDTGVNYNNLGLCYNNFGDFKKAIAFTEQALIIFLQALGEMHPYIAGCYSNLGILYEEQGNHAKAIAYFQKSLIIKLNILGEQHPDTALTYNNLGASYNSLRKYKNAIYFTQKALNIRLKILGKDHTDLGFSCNNLGLLYIITGNYKQAFNYLQQAISIYSAQPESFHPKTSSIYINLADCYQRQGNEEQALACYKQALEIDLAIYGEQNYSTAVSYLGFAVYYQRNCQANLALQYSQKALQALALITPDFDEYLLPEIKDYNGILELLDILVYKATAFFLKYQQTLNPKNLAASLAFFQCADQLIDQFRHSFKFEGSKLILAEKSKQFLCDKGLETVWSAEQYFQSNGQDIYQKNVVSYNQLLNYRLLDTPIEKAFYLSEKSKGMLLFAGMKDVEARGNSQLPLELKEQEYWLRIDLTNLEQNIIEEESKHKDNQDKDMLTGWQNSYFDCKVKYDALIEQLEIKYPHYYHLKYDLKVADISQIQSKLSPQTAMISYVVSDKYLYSIVITSQSANWLQQNIPDDFEGLVDDLLFSFEPFGKEDYITYAHNMYRILLQPLEQNGWLEGIGRLVIIPDGILSRIPFEALLTQSTSAATPYNQLNYLLHQYVISYHYSATLWLGQQTMDAHLPESETSFLGFAPVYNDNIQPAKEHDIDLSLDVELLANLDIELEEVSRRTRYAESEGVTRGKVEGKEYAELHYTEKEVQQAGRAFAEKGHASRVLLHQSATLDAFKQLAGRYRYLLIAAHADMDDEHPEQTGIIFSPNEEDGRGIFYMGDAYNLPLQAELVVLSCCESGLGKINKGEGTMALNRGFLYAGAKNVIFTLFKVYDRESCELTTVFFQQLLSGLTCAEALHSAKLQLAERGLMPLKWAGYVLVGK
ncbi:MAG: CHAT domain-containing protein [Sphingobacteriales bacterium]|nr:MAG: CHAT domain-containing protein [Sphingobacteriales bacterium]